MLDPMAYGLGGTVEAGLRWLDRLALLGFLLAVLLAAWLVRRNGFGQLEAAMALWSCLGLCLPRAFWADCYSGARVFTPLLIYVVALSPPLARWRGMAPLLLVAPRVAVQVFAPLLVAMGSPASR